MAGDRLSTYLDRQEVSPGLWRHIKYDLVCLFQVPQHLGKKCLTGSGVIFIAKDIGKPEYTGVTASGIQDYILAQGLVFSKDCLVPVRRTGFQRVPADRRAGCSTW